MKKCVKQLLFFGLVFSLIVAVFSAPVTKASAEVKYESFKIKIKNIKLKKHVISWKKQNVKEYTVRRDAYYPSGVTKVKKIKLSKNVTKYVDKDIKKNVEYSYTISGKNKAGTKCYTAQEYCVNGIAVDWEDYAAIECFTSTKKIVIKYCYTGSGIKADKFQIFRKTGKNGTYKKIASTKKFKYVDKNVKAGKKYFYKVRAIKKFSKKYTYKSRFSSGFVRYATNQFGQYDFDVNLNDKELLCSYKSSKNNGPTYVSESSILNSTYLHTDGNVYRAYAYSTDNKTWTNIKSVDNGDTGVTFKALETLYIKYTYLGTEDEYGDSIDEYGIWCTYNDLSSFALSASGNSASATPILEAWH